MALEEPICYRRKCKHLLGVKNLDGTEMTEFHYCRAFPNGIPEEILLGKNKHTEPFPGQENDIVFEKEEKS